MAEALTKYAVRIKGTKMYLLWDTGCFYSIDTNFPSLFPTKESATTVLNRHKKLAEKMKAPVDEMEIATFSIQIS